VSALVVTDASVLIALGRIGELDLLNQMYERVVAPREVAHEFGACPDWLSVEDVPDRDAVHRLVRRPLDLGEAEAIVLALSKPKATLLIDEARGRKVAAGFGLPIIGTAGVLAAAKERGLIDAVAPLLSELITAHDFRLSEYVRREILRLVGED
jgi:predicted nucleic acid-binding protein